MTTRRQQKTVSVVIPCYNVGDYISECLDSLIQQTYHPLEIICIDDGSSDNTVPILQRYKIDYVGLLTVIQNPANSGASASRNRGLRAARGDYIQFLDADDLLIADKLMHQVQMLDERSEPILVVGSYLRKQVDGRMIQRPMGHYSAWEGLIVGELGVTSANLWPRETLLEIDGWNESLGSSQEYDLMFRLLKRNITVVFDTEFLTIMRERASGSISQKDPSANSRRFIELRVQMLKHLREAGASNTVQNAALQRIFEVIRILYKYDSETAKRFYRDNIRGRYSPHLSRVISRKYLFLYNLVGFELAERIKSAFSRNLSV